MVLHPHMEHGLGYAFLNRLLAAIAAEHVDYEAIQEKLQKKLRGHEDMHFSIELEKNVASGAFVDIVIAIDNYRIGIENKIYAGSASDMEQLNREYRGMMAEYGQDNDCALVFLVPSSFGALAPSVQRAFDTFDGQQLRKGDHISLMTWQRNEKGYPSIEAIIKSILQDEAMGEIEPMPEYTRHTVKALRSFICGNFQGYVYEKPERKGTQFPYVAALQLALKAKGYVGIRGGIKALMRYSAGDLKQAQFQYDECDEDTGRGYQWLPMDTFGQVYAWRLHGKSPDIAWDKQPLFAEQLYELSKSCGDQKLYVGMQGGAAALERMDNEKIRSATWPVTRADAPASTQWFALALLGEILARKGVFDGAEGDGLLSPKG